VFAIVGWVPVLPKRGFVELTIVPKPLKVDGEEKVRAPGAVSGKAKDGDVPTDVSAAGIELSIGPEEPGALSDENSTRNRRPNM
jgi:hypothetical protein